MIDGNNEKLQVNLDCLIKYERAINKETETIKNKVEILKNNIDDLQLFWQGKAAETFKSSFYSDLAEIENFISTAKWLSESFSFAVNTYESCDQKAMEMVEAINF
jgi:uncharacterized protein YukE